LFLHPIPLIERIDALEKTLDVLSTSLSIKGEGLNFVSSNEAHCRIIGSPVEPLLGLSCVDFCPAAQALKFRAGDKMDLQSNEPR
jgi:hypothetical protein